MDWYNELKSEVTKNVKDAAKNIVDLNEQIRRLNKRIEDETANVQNFEQRIQTLKEKSSESLLGDAGSYEKFKVNLRKLNIQKDNALDIIKTLNKELLPSKKEQLAKENVKLDQAIIAMAKAKVPDVEKRMTAIIEQVIDERDNFIFAFVKLAADFGASFSMNNREVFPQPKHERIDTARHGFFIKPLNLAEKDKRLQKNS